MLRCVIEGCGGEAVRSLTLVRPAMGRFTLPVCLNHDADIEGGWIPTEVDFTVNDAGRSDEHPDGGED